MIKSIKLRWTTRNLSKMLRISLFKQIQLHRRINKKTNRKIVKIVEEYRIMTRSSKRISSI